MLLSCLFDIQKEAHNAASFWGKCAVIFDPLYSLQIFANTKITQNSLNTNTLPKH